MLGGDEIQAALQELLAVRLTDAPETDAARARDAVRAALGAAAPDAAALSGALAGYYDDQICALVARLEGEEPPLLAQIRSEAFSARISPSCRRSNVTPRRWPKANDGAATAGRRAARAAGRLLAGVTDPFDLEVHRAVQAGDAPPGLPALPTYVPREHDRELAEAGAGGGRPGTAGSRCWSAGPPRVRRGRAGRRWACCGTRIRRGGCGIRSTRPVRRRRCASCPSFGPRTVVWLNEAQLLPRRRRRAGERVAAGLRQLLRDPAGARCWCWPRYGRSSGTG